MPRSKKLFLGSPPFQFLAGHLVQDEDFLEDMRKILKLDQDVYNRLATQLAETNVFLDRPSLISLTSEIIDEEEEARNIASVIYQIGNILHDAHMPVQEAMDEFGKAINKGVEGIEPKDRQILIDRLRTLTANPPGLAKQYKARQLVDATGFELDEFQLICDIRPIFDQDRERIEGAIPLAILRLDYSTPNGESEVVEMRITEKQLDEFEIIIVRAKRKFNLIKKFVTSQDILIPKTKSTVSNEE